jgi:hypothetical protein
VSANRRIETLMDAARHGFNIEVRCGRCAKRRVLDAKRLMTVWLRHPSWSMRIGQLHERLRCDHCQPIDVHVRLTGEQPDRRRQPRHPDEG